MRFKTVYLFLTITIISLILACEDNKPHSISNSPPPTCESLIIPTANLNSSFDIYDTTTNGWNNFKTYINGVTSQNNLVNIEAEFLEIKDKGRNLFRGGVLTKNGNVLFIPQTPTNKFFYLYEPQNDFICSFAIPTEIQGIWAGGVLLESGKIISFPIKGNNIIEIDTDNFSTKVVAQTNGNTYGSQLIAPNGLIYGTPYESDNILILNPINYSVTTIDLPKSYKFKKWYSASLTQEGLIYAIPLTASKVMEINTNANTYSLIGDSYNSEGLKWAGSVIAMNGKVYAAPDDHPSILEIDPITKSTSLIGNFGSVKQKWSFGFLGPDGHIYFAPDSGSSILRLNPATDETQELLTFSGDDKWNSIIYANGYYVGIPDSSGRVIKISFEDAKNFDTFIQRSPFYNKY